MRPRPKPTTSSTLGYAATTTGPLGAPFLVPEESRGVSRLRTPGAQPAYPRPPPVRSLAYSCRTLNTIT